MKKPVILDLCSGSGAWSRPYVEADYNVLRLDILTGGDIRLLKVSDIPLPVRGVLAAPPCTHFSRAGAHLWPAKGVAALLVALSTLDACLRIIHVVKPAWWALENPIGRIKDYLGEPVFKFDPCDFGDPWTKRTWLYGQFRPPVNTPVLPVQHPKTGGRTRTDRTTAKAKNQRSITPFGFAEAFFKANP